MKIYKNVKAFQDYKNMTKRLIEVKNPEQTYAEALTQGITSESCIESYVAGCGLDELNRALWVEKHMRTKFATADFLKSMRDIPITGVSNFNEILDTFEPILIVFDKQFQVKWNLDVKEASKCKFKICGVFIAPFTKATNAAYTYFKVYSPKRHNVIDDLTQFKKVMGSFDKIPIELVNVDRIINAIHLVFFAKSSLFGDEVFKTTVMLNPKNFLQSNAKFFGFNSQFSRDVLEMTLNIVAFIQTYKPSNSLKTKNRIILKPKKHPNEPYEPDILSIPTKSKSGKLVETNTQKTRARPRANWVPGHWKKQVSGVGRSERKLIFISPYFRPCSGTYLT